MLDYGCIAYGSAAKSSLKKLEVVQAQALRTCCGAFKMTPLTAIQVELGEMPLHIRRKQLMMNYWTNLQGHSEDRHPTKKVLLPCWERERARRECFAWSSEEIAKVMTLKEKRYIPKVPLPVTPWLFPSVSMDLYILEKIKIHKDFGNIAVLVEDRLQTVYQTFVQVYTDGSKDPSTGTTGFAFNITALEVSVKRRTSDNLSVFTVEMGGNSNSITVNRRVAS